MMRRFYYLLGIMMMSFFFVGCDLEEKNKPAVIEPVTGLPATPSPFLPTSDMVDLHCENYVTTRWGNETTEWGFPDGFHGSINTRLLPLKFDLENRLYFFDFANERLLIYNDDSSPKPISLKPLLIWEEPTPFFFAITVHEDKIFIPYHANYLGILAVNGEVLARVKLPFSYDKFLPAESVVEIDPNGRLCTFKGTYDKGWENGEWRKVAGGCMDTYFWDDYSVTGDKNVAMTNEILEIQNLTQGSTWFLETGLPKSNYPISSLFGVDSTGNAYLGVTSTPPTWIYAKYSLVTHQTQIGRMQLDAGYTVAVPSVAPDGTLYILVYADRDLSVHPRILRCEFPAQ